MDGVETEGVDQNLRRCSGRLGSDRKLSTVDIGVAAIDYRHALVKTDDRIHAGDRGHRFQILFN